MSAVGKGAKLKYSAGGAVAVGKLVGDKDLRNNGLATSVRSQLEGVASLELFVGMEHGDDKFLELKDKGFILILAKQVIFSNIADVAFN